MDYSRPVTAGSDVVMLRGGYRVQVTVGRNFINPQAAGIVEVLRYGPAEQDAEEDGEEEQGTPATQALYDNAEKGEDEDDGEDDEEEYEGEEEDKDAPAPPTQLLTTSPAPAHRTPAPRKGPSPSNPAAMPQRRRLAPRKRPAAPAPNALPRRSRRVPRKGPAASNPAALPNPNPPAQAPPAPTQAPGPDSFNGLGPVNGTCDTCRSKKKGCNGDQQRPCTRCKALGFSAAECVNSRDTKPDMPGKANKRDRKDDDGDENGDSGDPPAKRRRDRPKKHEEVNDESQGNNNGHGDQSSPAPVYSAADGVSAVGGRGIRVPVKVRR
ncbi:hypothetical protein AC579_10195 [Pseudocercospora musae]|uniref:Zn(2)-C6 fungal-type domain-containing protein n=1 Tax=Pseudocercospora musae TaxID=113226 RepID=A0A139I349_9PEZI|nr:hypothetical protein AC579_10195 [Pseudocercospora musae]